MYVCILVFKCLNDIVPDYFSGYFTKNNSFHQYNARKKTDLHLLRVKRALGKQSFQYNGTWQFNELPFEMKS